MREIEVMLGMVLRLPEGSGKKARLEAFKGAVDSMIENAEQRGLSGFKEVDSKYQQVCVCVCVCVCKGSWVLCTSHTCTVEISPTLPHPLLSYDPQGLIFVSKCLSAVLFHSSRCCCRVL